MHTTQTNPTTELAPSVDLKKYFSSDVPSEMRFIYKGDLVKYSCTQYPIHVHGNETVDTIKVFKVADASLFITKIYKNHIRIGRYMLGKSINFCLRFNEFKIISNG